MMEEPQLREFPDGSVEITDTRPKQAYYQSLRKSELLKQNNAHQSMELLQTSKTGTLKKKKKTKQAILEFKPSGTMESCNILMLEGVEKTFTIDRNAYGIHLFDKICQAMDLRETEYFGLSYRTSLRVNLWLKLDEKLSKQLETSPWKLEFHVRFYPAYVNEFKDDLTRYCVCLQLRQDLVTGRIPCTRKTYAILGAYVVQSDAGDYDRNLHQGIDYISKIPFAPESVQDAELLHMIVAHHRYHKGLSPVQADHRFFENARRLALYGIDLHKAKTLGGEAVQVGVYYGGIVIYRGSIRLRRYPWFQIVKLFQKSKSFHMNIQAADSTSSQRNGQNSIFRSLSNSSLKSGTLRRSRSSERKPIETWTETYQCANSQLAKRLLEECIAQHAFFRLRDVPRRLPNLTTAFNSRKYQLNAQSGMDDHSGYASPSPTLYPQPAVRRVPTQRKPQNFDTSPLATPMMAHREFHNAPFAELEDVDQMYSLPVSPSRPPITKVEVSNTQSVGPSRLQTGPTRIPLEAEHWRMSPADCTYGLGMDAYGTDLAVRASSGWQGCRSKFGLTGNNGYYYEVVMNTPVAVRVGWAGNDASRLLGCDSLGFGYGADDSGAGSMESPHATGRFVHDNISQEYGLKFTEGDVIGCYIDLTPEAGDGRGFSAHWSYNGCIIAPPEFKIPFQLPPGEGIFPAIAMNSSRVNINFGDSPFNFAPVSTTSNGTPWIPVAKAEPNCLVPNRIAGWIINPNDITSSENLMVAPNGRMIQAKYDAGWQGFRVNQGVYGGGKYYYEVEVMEDSGFARIGWSTASASLLLGTDKLGYGYGADASGLTRNGQGRKLHNNESEPYGQAISKGDTIGCLLDLDNGVIQYSRNGTIFMPAYNIDPTILKLDEPLFPAGSLVNTTLKINCGDLLLKYESLVDYVPLSAATEDHVFQSPKYSVYPITDRKEEKILLRHEVKVSAPKPPERTTSQLTSQVNGGHMDEFPECPYSDDVDPEQLAATNLEPGCEVRKFIHVGDPIKYVESYINSEGRTVTRTIEEQRTITGIARTHQVPNIQGDLTFEGDGEANHIHGEDAALINAILATTNLNRSTSVLNESLDVTPPRANCDEV